MKTKTRKLGSVGHLEVWRRRCNNTGDGEGYVGAGREADECAA